MNFKQLIAKYATGNIPADQIPQLGVAALLEGIDTPSICILAGLDKNENAFVKEHYLKLALNGLNMVMPDKRHAALEYACAIADEIISGEKELIAGVSDIKNKAIDSYDFWSENKKYVYDSICFETVYGLYDDLQNDLIYVNGDKSREELIIEVKTQLFDELIKWKEKRQLIM
jgi:hypothetical protein